MEMMCGCLVDDSFFVFLLYSFVPLSLTFSCPFSDFSISLLEVNDVLIILLFIRSETVPRDLAS